MDENEAPPPPIAASSQQVDRCVSCHEHPPVGRLRLEVELPLCGGCAVDARTGLASTPEGMAALARVVAKLCTKRLSTAAGPAGAPGPADAGVSPRRLGMRRGYRRNR